ncbi:unnamed protein product [Ceratitis capitata]|uniref:(Mediterranean fruit fly) hypothetical protein n=1 Tax=Ceratitis capitata TaxID=7213 RepID=A0A811U465_CERCA|nr:unnamed protein product [Ceratitis capitata]
MLKIPGVARVPAWVANCRYVLMLHGSCDVNSMKTALAPLTLLSKHFRKDGASSLTIALEKSKLLCDLNGVT